MNESLDELSRTSVRVTASYKSMFVVKVMDEGVTVSFKNRFIETRTRPWIGRRVHHRAARNELDAEGKFVEDQPLELSSVDMEVTFFEDYLEFRRRLGSKHGVIRYAQIQAVDQAEKSWPTIRVSADDIFESSPTATKMMVLTVQTHRSPVTFDFRSEPSERIQEALDIIRRGVNLTANRTDDARYVGTSERNIPARSRADELMKLAALRDTGVLTQEEFEIEKARILQP